MLFASASLVLHHICNMRHLCIIYGIALNQFVDVVLQVLVISAPGHGEGAAVTLAACRVVLRPNGARVFSAPHLLEAFLRIVYAREQRLVSLCFEM